MDCWKDKYMKVAFIVDQFPALSQTFILNQITGLIDRGHEVDIYAHSSGNESKIHADVERYKLLNRTFYLKVPENKLLRLVKGVNLIIRYFHKRPTILLKVLNIFKFRKDAASLTILYKIIPFLNNRTYDIIHCHFGPNGNLGVLLKEMGISKGKIITSFHGFDVSYYIKNHGENVYDYLFAKGDQFLPISNRWKDELIRLGCSKEKIVIHRMGVDIGRFNFSPRKPKFGERVNLLSIARLIEKKGLQYGIRAVAKVLKDYSNIEYKIVGDGPLKGDLECLIKELNISDTVKLLGWKPQEAVIRLMKDTDILLAPSVTDQYGNQEGIPVVLMEALAQGIPVLSTYHSGIPELVTDGVSGFLVPERDINALADRLIYFIEHPEICPKMGRAGRRYVEKYFDINKLNDQLVDLYRQLIEKGY